MNAQVTPSAISLTIRRKEHDIDPEMGLSIEKRRNLTRRPTESPHAADMTIKKLVCDDT